jgi:hypothetical protein
MATLCPSGSITHRGKTLPTAASHSRRALPSDASLSIKFFPPPPMMDLSGTPDNRIAMRAEVA